MGSEDRIRERLEEREPTERREREEIWRRHSGALEVSFSFRLSRSKFVCT